MSFSYAFILGRLPAISIAEILAVMEKLEIKYQIKIVSQKTLILDIEKEIDCQEILGMMGGTIKILEIGIPPLAPPLQGGETSFPLLSKEGLGEVLTKIPSNKIIIGYSIYSDGKIEKDKLNQISKSVKKNLIALKKELKKEKISCRIITPKDYETELSSASIVNNKILEKGVDLNFIIKKNPPSPLSQRGNFQEGNIKITLGKTVAIQDIESYSQRDYERPCREAKIGMMPPKLAQIMLNLAQAKKDQLILDPFCGTGVILQEALLVGSRVIGSDANEKQVQNTKNNLEWLMDFSPPCEGEGRGRFLQQYHNKDKEEFYQILKIDAMHLAKKIKHSSIDAIVTETTLGPIYLKNPSPKEIRRNFKKLEKMYLKFLIQAKKVLKPDGKIVMTIPCYQIKENKFILMPLIDIFKKTGYSVKESLPKDILDELDFMSDTTARNTLIYSRKNQIVGREIIILE